MTPKNSFHAGKQLAHSNNAVFVANSVQQLLFKALS